MGWMGSLLLAGGLCLFGIAQAQTISGQVPKELEGVAVEEHLGKTLDLSLPFVDQDGKSVTLGDYFKDGKPVLLSLNYYRCTMLCNLQLGALVDTFKQLGWPVGDKFRMVTVSIDPQDEPSVAGPKRTGYLSVLGQPQADWSFLSTSNQADITRLAEQVGFQYKYDAASGEFAHAAVLYVLSPKGVISRYLYGIQFPVQNLKFALIDAGEGRIGTTVDRLIMTCFHYVASEGRYSPFAFGMMRLGAILTLITLGMFMAGLWSGERLMRRSRAAQSNKTPTPDQPGGPTVDKKLTEATT